MDKKKSIWKKHVDKHDYGAALDYLLLLYNRANAESYINKMLETKICFKKAKDLFRASELTLLPATNKHVKENLKKFKKGIKLSPILLVATENKLIIADGFHRLSASYVLSEDEEVPCILVN